MFLSEVEAAYVSPGLWSVALTFFPGLCLKCLNQVSAEEPFFEFQKHHARVIMWMGLNMSLSEAKGSIRIFHRTDTRLSWMSRAFAGLRNDFPLSEKDVAPEWRELMNATLQKTGTFKPRLLVLMSVHKLFRRACS